MIDFDIFNPFAVEIESNLCSNALCYSTFKGKRKTNKILTHLLSPFSNSTREPYKFRNT